MNEQQFLELGRKYGKYSSWAIWNDEDEADPTVVQSYCKELNARHVFIGYNASGEFRRGGPWANFRGGKHDRKLKYACNDTVLRGSYLTDLFKGIKEADSKRVQAYLTDKVVKDNVSFFLEEISDIGTTKETVCIILGAPNSDVGKLFREHFLERLGGLKVIYQYHYSYYGLTDQKWVEGLWKELGIKADYETIRKKYR
jgi:hypothetical protein